VVDIGSIFNPEYDIDISKSLPRIADYGNIQITTEPGKSQKPSQMDLLNKLTTKVSACIMRSNIPFIIGGTRDVTYSVAQSISQT
jgi:hypothetical protein